MKHQTKLSEHHPTRLESTCTFKNFILAAQAFHILFLNHSDLPYRISSCLKMNVDGVEDGNLDFPPALKQCWITSAGLQGYLNIPELVMIIYHSLISAQDVLFNDCSIIIESTCIL